MQSTAYFTPGGTEAKEPHIHKQAVPEGRPTADSGQFGAEADMGPPTNKRSVQAYILISSGFRDDCTARMPTNTVAITAMPVEIAKFAGTDDHLKP